MTIKRPDKRVDFVAKARTAWGKALPDWVAELALLASNTSQAAAAECIGYSPPVVSQVIGRTYRGDLGRVEAKVRGALMNEIVACQVLGEIGLDQCLDEQAKPFAATSSVRARVFRACRAGCPHSRLKHD